MGVLKRPTLRPGRVKHMFLKLLADVPLNSAITLNFFSVENWKDKSGYILKLIVDVLSA